MAVSSVSGAVALLRRIGLISSSSWGLPAWQGSWPLLHMISSRFLDVGGCAVSIGGGGGSGRSARAVDAVLAVAVLVQCSVSAWAVRGHVLGMARRDVQLWWLGSLLVEWGLRPGAVEVPCRYRVAAGGW